tara:strand:- start:135 stop:728 length:594 start_codon:yes stop_codon:yes gene_type:complete
MPHFKTYFTKRLVKENFKEISAPLFASVKKFEEAYPEILRRVEKRFILSCSDGKEVEISNNVWLYAGNFSEFVNFVRSFYVKADLLEHFTPGTNDYVICESAIAMVPLDMNIDHFLDPVPLPKIRSHLASPNFFTFASDDWPDVDVALSNNSFTLPLTEAVKLAEQIRKIADYHGVSAEESKIQNSCQGSSAAAKHT